MTSLAKNESIDHKFLISCKQVRIFLIYVINEKLYERFWMNFQILRVA